MPGCAGFDFAAIFFTEGFDDVFLGEGLLGESLRVILAMIPGILSRHDRRQ